MSDVVALLDRLMDEGALMLEDVAIASISETGQECAKHAACMEAHDCESLASSDLTRTLGDLRKNMSAGNFRAAPALELTRYR